MASKEKSTRRILIVDDHPMMRQGLAQLIDNEPDLKVMAQAETGGDALDRVIREKVDLILLDISLPDKNGLEVIKDIHVQKPDLAILVVSMHDEGLYAERVLRAGARGYIMKEAGGENLLAAIRQVLRGEVYVSPRMSARILEAVASRRPRGSRSPIEKLTDREFEVFQLIGQGKGTRDIADHLHLSVKTVEVHRANIKEKLKLKSATDLVRHAVRWTEAEGAA